MEIKTDIGSVNIPESFVIANMTKTEKERIVIKHEVYSAAKDAENKQVVFRELAARFNVTPNRLHNIYYREIRLE